MNMGRVLLIILILFVASSNIFRFDKATIDMDKGACMVESNKPDMLMCKLTGKIKFNAGFFRDMRSKVKRVVEVSSAVTSQDSSSQG